MAHWRARTFLLFRAGTSATAPARTLNRCLPNPSCFVTRSPVARPRGTRCARCTSRRLTSRFKDDANAAQGRSPVLRPVFALVVALACAGTLGCTIASCAARRVRTVLISVLPCAERPSFHLAPVFRAPYSSNYRLLYCRCTTPCKFQASRRALQNREVYSSPVMSVPRGTVSNSCEARRVEHLSD